MILRSTHNRAATRHRVANMLEPPASWIAPVQPMDACSFMKTGVPSNPPIAAIIHDNMAPVYR